MFKFKGISSEDMQVIIEEEEHFIARASQRYEMTEIEGRDGAIFDTLGYSIVERPIYVQCLNIEKIDDILAWLNGEGEFEYKGRKTIARFYSQLEPQRNSCIRIIDTTFIRDPFWTKAEDEYETINDSRVRTTEVAEALTITDCAGVNGKLDIKSGKSEQKVTTQGANLLDESKMTTKIFTTGTRVKLVAGEDFVKKEGRLTISVDVKAMTDVEYSEEGNLVSIDFENEDGTMSYGGVVSSSSKVGDRGSVSSLTTKNLKSITLVGHSRFTSGTIEIENIAIKEGTDNVYEEFVPDSPTPKYPSPIRNVGDNIQLFDKDNANTLKALINGTSKLVTAYDTCRTIYIPCLNNEDYTVSKKDGTRFIIGTTTDLPNIGLTCNQIVADNTASSLTISTTDSDNYLLVFYYNSGSDTLTEEEIRNSIKIEKGPIATSPSEYGCGSVGFKVKNRNICNNVVLSSATNIFFYADKERIEKTITLSFTPNVDLSNNSVYLVVNGTSQGIISTLKGSANTRVSTTITLSDELYSAIKESTTFYFQLYKSNVVFTLPTDAQIENGDVLTNYIENPQETVIFPLAEGQLLHKGDYLADDGIHQNKVTIVLDGTEKWYEFSTQKFDKTNMYYMYTGFKFKSYNGVICSHFKYRELWDNDNEGIALEPINETNFRIRISNEKANSVEEFKAYLAEQYANGTPIMAECDLAEETVTPYTEEQKEAYYQLQHLLMYEGYTSIECIDEIKPDIQVEYEEILDVTIENEGNIESRPILKINKAKREKVDLTINNLRFKVNFVKDEEYVEIDTKEKTILYNGLNRYRQVEIGYEFPKLSVGQNKIKFNEGDAILEVKRKDRWL